MKDLDILKTFKESFGNIQSDCEMVLKNHENMFSFSEEFRDEYYEVMHRCGEVRNLINGALCMFIPNYIELNQISETWSPEGDATSPQDQAYKSLYFDLLEQIVKKKCSDWDIEYCKPSKKK